MTYNKFEKKPFQKSFQRTPFVKKERVKMGWTVEVRYPPNPSEEQKTRSFTNAMKKFKNMVKDENIIQDYRDNQFYEKPSIVRNKAKAMAKKRWAKKRKEIKQERGW